MRTCVLPSPTLPSPTLNCHSNVLKQTRDIEKLIQSINSVYFTTINTNLRSFIRVLYGLEEVANQNFSLVRFHQALSCTRLSSSIDWATHAAKASNYTFLAIFRSFFKRTSFSLAALVESFMEFLLLWRILSSVCSFIVKVKCKAEERL